VAFTTAGRNAHVCRRIGCRNHEKGDMEMMGMWRYSSRPRLFGSPHVPFFGACEFRVGGPDQQESQLHLPPYCLPFAAGHRRLLGYRTGARLRRHLRISNRCTTRPGRRGGRSNGRAGSGQAGGRVKGLSCTPRRQSGPRPTNSRGGPRLTALFAVKRTPPTTPRLTGTTSTALCAVK
jgi:hypothetical protein